MRQEELVCLCRVLGYFREMWILEVVDVDGCTP